MAETHRFDLSSLSMSCCKDLMPPRTASDWETRKKQAAALLEQAAKATPIETLGFGKAGRRCARAVEIVCWPDTDGVRAIAS